MRLLRRISIFALPVLLLAGACDEPVLPENSGGLTGQLDGVAWEGDAQVLFFGDTVAVFSSRTEAGIGYHLGFAAVAQGPGEYQLLSMSDYRETVGGDVLTYHAAITGGTIRFTSLDRGSLLAAGTISGVTIEGPRGSSTFSQGEFIGEVSVLR